MLGPIYTIQFLSHATNLRQAYDITYDWRVRQKNVVAFLKHVLNAATIVNHVVRL